MRSFITYQIRISNAMQCMWQVSSYHRATTTSTMTTTTTKGKKKQCAKRINEMKRMHFRFLLIYFFFLLFSLLKHRMEKWAEFHRSPLFYLSETRIFHCCVFFGAPMPTKKNLLEWFYSNGIVFHSCMNSKQTKPNEFFSISILFSSPEQKEITLTRLVIAKEEGEE